ncbi:MAG TPA: DUF4340 domain-containing protein [Terriglobales bacterium]|nr:DUF4340 domain-containing protein [Terriglobales bacterium]
MKFRGLIFALAVLAGLVGALYWSNQHKPADTVQASVDTSPKILAFKAGNITTLDLKKKGAPEISLAKNASGQWEIMSPQRLDADQSAVSGMLSTLSSLDGDRLVEEKAADLSQFGLSAPALEVDVAGKGNSVHELLIGDETPTSSGSYAKVASDPRVFTIATYTKTNIDKGVNDLRDKRLLRFEPDKVVRLDLNANQQQIEFGRNKDQWEILKPKPLRANGFTVDDLVSKLSQAKMNLSAFDEKKAESAFASGKPVASATVTTDSGTESLQLRKQKDSYYAKSSLVPGVYSVGGDLGDALNKKLDDFRNKKLFDFGYVDPDKIEIHAGDKTYFLTKGGDDWFSADGKKLDAVHAQSVVDKVRDLDATKFANSGFSAPSLSLIVTSNSGKRVEKVQIAKDSNDYLAKRQDDPSLYVLDKSTVDELEKAANDLKPAVPKKS